MVFNVYDSKVTRDKGEAHVALYLNMKALCLMVGKLCAELKFFSNVGQRSRSMSRDQNLWYYQKGLVIRNTCQI